MHCHSSTDHLLRYDADVTSYVNDVQALRQGYWASLRTQQQQQKTPSVWDGRSTGYSQSLHGIQDDKPQHNGAASLLWQAFAQQKQPCCTAQPTGLATLQHATPGMFQHMSGIAAAQEPVQTVSVPVWKLQPTSAVHARQLQLRPQHHVAASNSNSPTRSSYSDTNRCNSHTSSDDSSSCGSDDEASRTAAAPGTLSNTQQAYTHVERAAPAYSFSKSSRWDHSQHPQHDDQNDSSNHRYNTRSNNSNNSSKFLQAAEAAAAADAYATARRLLGLAPGEGSTDVDPAAAEAYAAARQVLGLPPNAVLPKQQEQQQYNEAQHQKKKCNRQNQSPWALSACAEAATAAARSKQNSRCRQHSPTVVQHDATQQLDASPSPTTKQQHSTADATGIVTRSIGTTVRVSAGPATQDQQQQQDAQPLPSQSDSMHSHTSTQQLQHYQAAGDGNGAGAMAPTAAADGIDLLKPK
jgi:hypothetical protein